MNHPDLEIRQDWSPVENYIKFNNMSKNRRRIAPMSPVRNGFVSFSELELLSFFWARPPLQGRLRELVRGDFPFGVSLDDISRWLGTKESGFLIKRFLADVDPQKLSSRQKGRVGLRAAVKLWTVPKIKEHLDPIGKRTIDPFSYNTKGYFLQGTIKTNGHAIQLLGFKLKELQFVRYKQLPQDLLPDRLTSTVGGVVLHEGNAKHCHHQGGCNEIVATLSP